MKQTAKYYPYVYLQIRKLQQQNIKTAIQVKYLLPELLNATFLYPKIFPRMFRHKNIPLLRHRHMGIDLCNIDRTMPKHLSIGVISFNFMLIPIYLMMCIIVILAECETSCK